MVVDALSPDDPALILLYVTSGTMLLSWNQVCDALLLTSAHE